MRNGVRCFGNFGENVIICVNIRVIFGKMSDISAAGSAKRAAKLVKGLPPPSLPIIKSLAETHKGSLAL